MNTPKHLDQKNADESSCNSYAIRAIPPENTLLRAPARQLLLVLICLSSICIIAMVKPFALLDVGFTVFVLAIGLLAIYFTSMPSRQYYTGLVTSLFYFFGYAISLGAILHNKNSIPRTGFMSIGNFDFSASEYFNVALVIFFGMSGVVLSTILAEKLFGKSFSAKDILATTPSKKKLCLAVLAWFFMSIAIIAITSELNIGRVGLTDGSKLPFKIAGFLYYSRKITVPLLGLFFLQICVKSNFIKLTYLTLISILVIAALGALTSLSRYLFAFTAFPPLIFLLLAQKEDKWKKSITIQYTIVCIIVGIFIFPKIQNLRNIAYQGQDIRISRLITPPKVPPTISVPKIKISKSPEIFFSLATIRLTGIRELLAVTSSGVGYVKAPYDIFMGNSNLSGPICNRVFGFELHNKNGLAFGISYGLWGQLYLTKKLMCVFIGTVVLLFPSFCFEHFFASKKLTSVTLFAVLMLSFAAWSGGLSLYTLTCYSIFLFFSYIIILLLLRALNTNRISQ
ncbi:MAG: hypothetical protein KAJ18_06415 [Candidatus Omnitrophica bacterium]|nr:hypothetical protein [Candidatus Omnitrophota bacterium]